MTRKHFKAIAETIKNLKTLSGQDKKDLINELSSVFYDLNTNFDKEIFVKACYEND